MESQRFIPSENYLHSAYNNQTNSNGIVKENDSFGEENSSSLAKEKFIREASQYLQFQVGEAIHDYYFPTIICIGELCATETLI